MSEARRITGAEALALKAAATPGPWADDYERTSYVHAPPSSLGDGEWICEVNYPSGAANAALLAAAPDLAESLAAAEAERDALRAKIVAYGQAHDARTAHSKRADSGAELWFAERDELNNAVSDALAALREAAK